VVIHVEGILIVKPFILCEALSEYYQLMLIAWLTGEDLTPLVVSVDDILETTHIHHGTDICCIKLKSIHILIQPFRNCRLICRSEVVGHERGCIGRFISRATVTRLKRIGERIIGCVRECDDMSSVLGFVAEIPALREIAKEEVVSRVNDPLLGCRPGETLG
jgi:hypothetical protein